MIRAKCLNHIHFVMFPLHNSPILYIIFGGFLVASTIQRALEIWWSGLREAKDIWGLEHTNVYNVWLMVLGYIDPHFKLLLIIIYSRSHRITFILLFYLQYILTPISHSLIQAQFTIYFPKSKSSTMQFTASFPTLALITLFSIGSVLSLPFGAPVSLTQRLCPSTSKPNNIFPSFPPYKALLTLR